LIVFVADSSGQEINRIHERIAQALNPEVQSIYIDAITALRRGDVQLAIENYKALVKKSENLPDNVGVVVGLAGQAAGENDSKNYGGARELLNTAILYLTDAVPSETAAWIYAAAGEVSLRLDDPRSAITAFNRFLDIARDLIASASPDELKTFLTYRGEVFRQKATAHERLREFDEALETILLAVEDLEQSSNRALLAQVRWQAGDAFLFGRLKPKEAIQHYDRATIIFQELENYPSAVITRTALGWSYLHTSQREKARTSFADALKLAQEHSVTQIYSDVKHGLALIAEQQHDLEGALRWYREARDDVRPDSIQSIPTSDANFLIQMGKIYKLKSQYEPAIEHFLLAAAKAREQGHPKLQAESLVFVADVLSWLGEFKYASGYYKDALAIYREQYDNVQALRVLALLVEATARTANLPELQSIIGDINKHKHLIERDVHEKLASFWGDVWRIIDRKIQAADVESAQRDYAWSHNTDMHALTEQSTYYPEVAEFFAQIRTGIQLKRLWIKEFPTLENDYLYAVGSLFQKGGAILLLADNPKEAVTSFYNSTQHFLMLLGLGRDILIELAKNYFFMGSAYQRLNENNAALFYFNLAFYIADYLRTPEIHWVYASRAQVHAKLGDYDNALSDFRESIRIIEAVQRQSGVEEIKLTIVSASSYVYRDFVDFLLLRHEQIRDDAFAEEAYQYMQRGKARVFAEMLEKSIDARREEGSKKNVELEQAIARVYSELRHAEAFSAKGRGLLSELDSLRSEQSRAVSSARVSHNAPIMEAAKLAEIQDRLSADTVLLDYVDSRRGITFWAITKDQAQYFRVPEEASTLLFEFIETLRLPLIGATERKRHLNLGIKLYAALIEPAKTLLEGKSKLLISPDAGLNYLPFETLIMPDHHRKDPQSIGKTIPYLLTRFGISYTPSGSAFVIQSRPAATKSDAIRFPLVAFGDPIYLKSPRKELSTATRDQLIGKSLKRLEFSNEEVVGAAQVWGVSSKSDHINLGENASIERFKEIDLSRYKIIHLATHGLLKDQFGVFSQPALAFSQKEGDRSGGLLKFSDIVQVKQNAELVILSACDTALGELRDGEGLIGLTRAFLYGGAAATVVSLWQVEDQSTSLLMQKFHGALRKGYAKDEALREAKLEIMQSRVELKATGNQESLSAPFYWASFILIGDRSPISFN
jgi:CHAT domain-containing protein/Tfp pilus assembly protein PilF